MRRTAMRLLAVTGLLGAWHRRRNRDVLTVLSLHRVLPEEDPRWQGADPLYTISTRFFDQLLAWLPRHYSVVGLQDLEAARAGERYLPPCPLVITFDDGWADNCQHALPLLLRHRLPAVLFCAGDAIDRHEGFFQERLVSAWRRGLLGTEVLRELWITTAVPDTQWPAQLGTETALRMLIARLQAIAPAERRRMLEPLEDVLADDQRQMVTAGELRTMAAAGIAIGTHGKQHEPLPGVEDLPAELHTCRQQVALAAGLPLQQIASISFPFSKQNGRVLDEARREGYRLLFGGGLSLTPLEGGLPDLIARVGITAGPLQDTRGNLRTDQLASYLFRRPIAALRPG